MNATEAALGAQEMGLDGISVGVRYGEDQQENKLVLMKGGKMLPLLEKTKPEEQEATPVADLDESRVESTGH
ncbi:hypothetical protein NM208_g11543 [Fusarium decemcellulare]|uniref:Uncharacterized protein n=1 Tax=Fusarium decemcellulare TaxID=57161 RepID=A0ACC1RTB5_9HYPO|nr:hypothetical protein NM208_g11543 [Fusarium decemcellulare]